MSRCSRRSESKACTFMDSDIRQLLASLVPIKEDASIKDAVVSFHVGT